MSTPTTLLPFHPPTMSTAQLAAVSYLARYTGHTHALYAYQLRRTLLPTEIPAATGTVTTRNLATVMDTGSPELCLGPVAESYPPQCSGPPIEGWSWKDQRGVFEKSGDVRWGLFSVQGTWDGRPFTVTSATCDQDRSLSSTTPAAAPAYPIQ